MSMQDLKLWPLHMFYYGGLNRDINPHFTYIGLGLLEPRLKLFVAGWRHALWSEWPFIIIILLYEAKGSASN